MDFFKGSINDAEQAGEKLAAKAEVDLADLVQRLLAEGAEYKIVLTLSLERK